MGHSRAQLADPNCVVSDNDYDAILSAIMETSRGRWFLFEYARRNRNADTQVLLSALDTIKETLDLYKKASSPYLVKTAVSLPGPVNQPGMTGIMRSPLKTITHVRDQTMQAPVATGTGLAKDASLQPTTFRDDNAAFEFRS
jgi:hypothetical protein